MPETGGVRYRDILLALCGCLAGCATVSPCPSGKCDVPRELDKTVLPDYRIEPPDILLVDALTVAPKPPYHIQTLDILIVSVPNAFVNEPIAGTYPVDPDGTINLGYNYGSVKVAGLTLKEATEAIEKHLARVKEPKATVALGQTRILQQVRGQHLVTPDGKIRLGVYGSVPVVGLTVPEAKAAIENFLSQYLDHPEVSVDVVGYNSKVYYAILDGGGNGQTVLRLPITGNDTVLDALSQVGGLSAVSSKDRIWVSRPSPTDCTRDQVLPGDWVGITTRARTATNYQLLPGDRIYIQAAPMICFNTILQRIATPIESIFGVTLLGAGTVGSFPVVSGLGGIGGGGVR
jgi:polysaccharide biosynthesis/export protein